VIPSLSMPEAFLQLRIIAALPIDVPTSQYTHQQLL